MDLQHKIQPILEYLEDTGLLPQDKALLEQVRTGLATTDTAVTGNENLLAMLKGVRQLLSNAGAVLKTDLDALENKKRNWLGFNSPYVKRIAVLSDDLLTKLEIEINAMSPVASCLRDQMSSLNMEQRSATKTKIQYAVPESKINKLSALFELECRNYYRNFLKELESKTRSLRQEEFADFPEISPSALAGGRAGADLPRNIPAADLKAFEVWIKSGEQAGQIYWKNIMKTLRAPTTILFSGAFIASMLLGSGNIRSYIANLVKHYPILICFIFGGLGYYLILAIRADMGTHAHLHQEAVENAWSAMQKNLASHTEKICNAYRNELKKRLNKLSEQEREWYEAIKEAYLLPYFDKQVNPLKEKLNQLQRIELDLSRLEAEQQRPSLTRFMAK